MSDRFDAIIIGAGAAGLSAARILSGAGKTVCILEGRERIGGRIWTLHLPHQPLPVELGAEFVHGEAPATLSIAEAAGLLVVQVPDDHWWRRGKTWTRRDGFWQQMDRLLARIPKRGADISFAEFLNRRPRTPPLVRQMARAFVEGFNAAHADRISAASLRAEGGDSAPAKQFRIASGYDGVIEWLRAGLDPDRTTLRLGNAVTHLAWRRGAVQATTARGSMFHADAAVITIPLGVWKGPQSIHFDPPLREKQNAIGKLEVGQAVRIVFRFRERFWDEERDFFHSSDRFMPTWWTTAPFRAPLLTGWAGGHAADALLALGSDAVIDGAIESMASTFSVSRRTIETLLESAHTHDWQADPFSRGAYSYAGVGGAHAHDALAKPVASTLFFAGEATTADETGTVAGAIGTGRRAAAQLLRKVRM